MTWGQDARTTVPTSQGAPAVPERLVARERLTSLFDRAVALTFVVAPAGSGKTVVAAEWMHGSGASERGARWVSAPDLESLISALFSAVGLEPDAEESEPSHDEASRIERVVAALRAHVPSTVPAPIVIDDAHQLPVSSVTLLGSVLASSPHCVRLVLLSRRDLPLPLVPLDLAGRLVMIRAGQLGFDDGEAGQLVLSHAPGATASDVAQLQEHTRGWAAALILAARTLDAAEDPQTAHLMMRSTEQPVLDYLLSESLDGLSDRTREILMSICHEPEVTAESAAALSGHSDADELLTSLAREGLLVTAYPDGPGGGLVWRLHPLLLEALRRLAAYGTSTTTSQAHRRGAAYARAAGNHVDALRHAVLSGDEALLATFLLDLTPDLLASGAVDVVDRGLRHLSPVYRSEHPELLGIEALCRVQTGDVNEALSLIVRAENGVSVIDPTSGSARHPGDPLLRADLIRLRLWRARLGWGDLAEAIDAADTILMPSVNSTISSTRICATVLELSAAEGWLGDVESASRHASTALVMARSLGYEQLTVAALGQRALVDAAQGATRSASAHASECLQRAAEADLGDDVSTDRARLAQAWADFEALDLSAAAANLELSGSSAVSQDPLVMVLGALLRARLLLEAGHIEDAERVLDWPLAVAAPVPTFALALVSAVRAQLAATAGDDVTLTEQIDTLQDLGHTTEALLFSAIRTAFDGRMAEATAALDKLTAAPSPRPLVRSGVEAVRLALLLLGGDVGGAQAALPHLLTTVATHRHLHVLTGGLLARNDFLGSLRQEASREDSHPFTAEALAAMESYEHSYVGRHRPLLHAERAAPAVAGARAGSAWPRLISELTPREFEVFEQLALGGSYGDIARALFVTENTVKTHLASIYRKLGVERRAEALRVGRDHGLLVTASARGRQ